MTEEHILNRHKQLMQKIQKEWEEDTEYHQSYKENITGIRSSQVSALVMCLLKENVIE